MPHFLLFYIYFIWYFLRVEVCLGNTLPHYKYNMAFHLYVMVFIMSWYLLSPEIYRATYSSSLLFAISIIFISHIFAYGICFTWIYFRASILPHHCVAFIIGSILPICHTVFNKLQRYVRTHSFPHYSMSFHNGSISHIYHLAYDKLPRCVEICPDAYFTSLQFTNDTKMVIVAEFQSSVSKTFTRSLFHIFTCICFKN